MTNKLSLEEAVKLIKELDAKRTQGDWHPRKLTIASPGLYLQANGKTIADYRYKNGINDMKAAISIPLMVRIIAKLMRQREVAKEALNRCHEISGEKMDYGSCSNEIQKIYGCTFDALETLTSKEPCV